MPPDAFISHSHADKAVAEAACAILEHAGISCWIAPRDVPPGSLWAAAIVNAIDHCRTMVLIFSAQANVSNQILREVEKAVRKGIPIIPLRIENVEPTNSMEHFLHSLHWLDAWTPPLDEHLQRLVKAVKTHLEGGSGGAVQTLLPHENAGQQRRRLLFKSRRGLVLMGALAAVVALTALVIPYNIRCGQTLICSQTFIELEATADTIAMKLGAPAFNEWTAIVGEVDILRAVKATMNDVDIKSGSQVIVKRTGKEPLTLTVSAFEPARRNPSVIVRHLAAPAKSFEVATEPEPMELAVLSKDGSISVTIDGAPVQKINAPLRFRATANVVRFGLTENDLLLRGPVAVSGLSFSDVADPYASDPMPFSTLRQGLLKFTDLDGSKERALTTAENLVIAKPDGQINAVQMSENGIRTMFSGFVRGLQIERKDNVPLNLMPTVYERYSAGYAVASVALALMTLIISLAAARRKEQVQ